MAWIHDEIKATRKALEEMTGDDYQDDAERLEMLEDLARLENELKDYGRDDELDMYVGITY